MVDRVYAVTGGVLREVARLCIKHWLHTADRQMDESKYSIEANVAYKSRFQLLFGSSLPDKQAVARDLRDESLHFMGQMYLAEGLKFTDVAVPDSWKVTGLVMPGPEGAVRFACPALEKAAYHAFGERKTIETTLSLIVSARPLSCCRASHGQWGVPAAVCSRRSRRFGGERSSWR